MNVFGLPEPHYDSVNAYLLDLAKDVATLVDGEPAAMERFREQIGVYARTWERWAEAQKAERENRWTPAIDRLENPLAVFAPMYGGWYSAENEAKQLPGFYSLVAFLHDRELPHLEKINNDIVTSVEIIRETLLAPGNELESVNALRSDISCIAEACAIEECLNWVSIDLRDFFEQKDTRGGQAIAEIEQQVKAMSDADLFRHLAQMLELRPRLELLKDRTWRGVDRALAPWFGEAIERLKDTREKEVESLKYRYQCFVDDVRRQQTKNVRGRAGFTFCGFDHAGELADSFALLALEAERESELERPPKPTWEDRLAHLIQKLEEVERRKKNYQYRYPHLSYGGIPDPRGDSYWKERVQPWIDDVELDLAQVGATVKPQWPYTSPSWEQATAIVRQGRKPDSVHVVIQGLKVVQGILRAGDGAAGKEEQEKPDPEPNGSEAPGELSAGGLTAEWDVFISHASEDKEAFVRPLAVALQKAGVRVWLDELILTVGDSLRGSIDKGLARSRYGVVVISPDFLKKDWPLKELDGLFAQEVDGRKVILPVWHNVDAEALQRRAPLLAGRVGTSTAKGIDAVVADLMKAMK